MTGNAAASRDGFARGARWSAASAAGAIALPFLTFVAFARSMDPVLIGVVALAVAVAEVLKAFGATGLYESLLASKIDDDRDQGTALSVLLAAGLLLLPVHLALVLLLLSLTGAETTLPVTLVVLIGLRIPIDLATLQPQASLAIRGAYARIAQRNLLTNGVATALGLGLVAAGWPLAGLITYSLSLSILAFLFTVIGTRALRRPRWHGDRLRSMRGQAVAATGNRGLSMANTQLEQLMLGGLLGPLAFAHYNLGKRIEAAFNGVSNSFAQTLFQPSLAAAGNDQQRLHSLRQSLAVTSVVCGYGVAVFVATADIVTALLFGAAWLVAAPIAAVLALSGFIRALAMVQASLLSVTGRNGILLRAQVVSLLAVVTLTLASAPFGAVAVALAGTLRALGILLWLCASTGATLPVKAVPLFLRNAVLPFLGMLGLAIVARCLVLPAIVTATPPLPVALAAIACAAIAAASVSVLTILRLRSARTAVAAAA